MIYLAGYVLVGFALMCWIHHQYKLAVRAATELQIDMPPSYPIQLQIGTVVLWPLLVIPLAEAHIQFLRDTKSNKGD